MHFMNSTLRICYNIIHILGLCFCILIPWYYFPLSRIPTPLFCILFIMLLYPYTYRCYFYLSRIHAPLFCILYIMISVSLYLDVISTYLGSLLLYSVFFISCFCIQYPGSWYYVSVSSIQFNCSPVSSIYPLYPGKLCSCVLYISTVSYLNVLLYPLYIHCILVSSTYPLYPGKLCSCILMNCVPPLYPCILYISSVSL